MKSIFNSTLIRHSLALHLVVTPALVVAQDEGITDTPSPFSFIKNTPEVELEVRFSNDHQFRQDEIDYLTNHSSEMQSRIDLGVQQKLGSQIKLQADLNFEAASDFNTEKSNELSQSLEMKNLYLQSGNQDDILRLRVGRQALSDEMGWLVDESLDGIRMSRKSKSYKVDFSITRNDYLDGSQSEPKDSTYNTFARAELAIGNKVSIVQYGLHRHDTSSVENRPRSTTWTGVQVFGQSGAFKKLWLNSAARYGEQKRENENRSLRGYALDTGLTYVLNYKYNPSITFGYALGSGDSNPDSAIDNGFRQPGLESNKTKFNGIQKFRYLGEVLDPELANLSIVTLGAGFGHEKSWSIDAVFHHYEQVERTDRLRGSDIDFDPSGLSRAIGQELDFIAGYRVTKRFDVNAVAGVFRPGNAFAGTATSQRLLRVGLSYRFL